MIQISNSAASANKNTNGYSTLAGYREIGIPAVAAALCCEHMPAPSDEHASKYTKLAKLPDKNADSVVQAWSKACRKNTSRRSSRHIPG